MNQDQIIEEEETIRKAREHIVDSLNILIFTFLLILIILTIWYLKHKKFNYVHETGLAIFYGAIFGAIIRYAFKASPINTISLTADIKLDNLKDLPEYVYLNIPNKTQTFVYIYKEPDSNRTKKYVHEYEEKATFDPELFFNILLPPIIFQAGYSMKRKHFFRNFGAILMFALLGTAISSFCIAGIMYLVVYLNKSIKTYFSFADCLLFGAIVSATDPVTTLAIFNEQNLDLDLYALIFGESVLNDAVSIILAQQIDKFSNQKFQNFNAAQFFSALWNFFAVFLGSFLIGGSIGCVNALLTKFTKIKQYPSLETVLFILISYSTFLASEAAEFSGIVAVLICGVFQAHYTYNNLSKESQTQTREIFHLMSFITENFIFIYIGISMFTFRSHHWEASFILISFVAIIIARALNIYPLTFLINLTRSSSNKIELKKQHMMFFSGLRGAMAFALAIRNTSTEARQLILTTTSIIVIVTVIFCGGLTKKTAEWLKIESFNIEKENRKKLNEKSINKGKFKRILSRFVIFRVLRSLDKRYVKPFLTNCRPTLIETMPKFLLPLAKFFTTKEQMETENPVYDRNPLIVEENKSQLDFTEEQFGNLEIKDDLQMDQILC